MPLNINYADDLLCNNPPIQALGIQEFSAMVGRLRGHDFTWLDGVITIDGIEHKVSTVRQIQSQDNYLVVCNMGELGLGVFTQKLIPAGAVIACYAGVISTTPNTGDKYQFDNKRHQFISAKYQGNLSSFVQHAPANSEKGYEYSVYEAVFANIDVKADDTGMLWLVAKCDIVAQEQLVCDYVDDYWHNANTTPKNFDRFGRVLPYQGIMHMRDVFLLSCKMAAYLKNTARLDKLKQLGLEYGLVPNASFYESMLNTHDNLQEYLATFFLTSHLELLKILSAEDREHALTILENTFIADIDGFAFDSIYKDNSVVAKFKELSCATHKKDQMQFFAPTAAENKKFLKLQFEKKYFKIINPLIYYVPKFQYNQNELASNQSKYAKKAYECYKQGKFAEAASFYELALVAARDAANLENMQTKFVGANAIGINKDFNSRTIPLCINQDIRSLVWNLGSAYYYAAKNAAAAEYKHQYLQEAECCLATAVGIIQHLEPANTHDITRYYSRLYEVRLEMAADISQSGEISMSLR
jgi:hypothetical protein